VYVCLCNGVTSQVVAEAVASGQTTTKKVAAATCAGDTCGRCKATIRAMIAASEAGAAAQQPARAGRSSKWDPRRPG
jgi:bacterioferritin-associated ferredoxin